MSGEQSRCASPATCTSGAEASGDIEEDAAGAITKQLKTLTVDEEQEQRGARHIATISPSDFVTLQRLRSSGLACKLSTTSKNHADDNGSLFDDLINANRRHSISAAQKGDADGSVEDDSAQSTASTGNTTSAKDGSKKQSNDTTNSTTDQADKGVDLVARGPVRNVRSTPNCRPYEMPNGCQVVPQEPTISFTETQYCVSNSSTPETVLSDLGYSSASPSHQLITNNGSSAKEINQLPDDLSDFILEYSQCYTTPPAAAQPSTAFTRSCNSSAEECTQSNFESPLYRILVEDDCQSPLSALSAPQFSPVSPKAAKQSTTRTDSAFPSVASSRDGEGSVKGTVRDDRDGRPTKHRLRALIGDNEMSEAWAWTCKCVQELRGALCHQDPDGDSLLHIVIQHMDLAKIYALVEQMLKADDDCVVKSFDVANRNGETPLFLAVQKRSTVVVAYLLEAGANPNHQTLRPHKQSPLHSAASLGITDIVEVLCSCNIIGLNLLDGYESTALLCAVKNHSITFGDDAGPLIDNKVIIRILLDRGANPAIADACGNTIVHCAVDKLDADLIELFKLCVNDETLAKLVNKENKCGETPVERLQRLPERYQDERQRSNVFISLLRCGASVKMH